MTFKPSTSLDTDAGHACPRLWKHAPRCRLVGVLAASLAIAVIAVIAVIVGGSIHAVPTRDEERTAQASAAASPHMEAGMCRVALSIARVLSAATDSSAGRWLELAGRLIHAGLRRDREELVTTAALMLQQADSPTFPIIDIVTRACEIEPRA